MKTATSLAPMYPAARAGYRRAQEKVSAARPCDHTAETNSRQRENAFGRRGYDRPSRCETQSAMEPKDAVPPSGFVAQVLGQIIPLTESDKPHSLATRAYENTATQKDTRFIRWA